MASGVSLRTFLSRLIWLCMGPLVLLAMYLAVDHVNDLQERQERTATRLAATLATALDQTLAARIATLNTLAASPHLDDEAGLASFYRSAQGFRDATDAHLIVADTRLQMRLNTRVPFGTPLPALPQPRGAAAPVALATGRPVVGDQIQGPVAAEPLVVVVVPVLRDGQAKWLLLATTATATLQARLDRRPDIPAGWAVTLRDGQRAVLARKWPPGFDPGHDVEPSGRHVMGSTLSNYSVAVEIPRVLEREPLLEAGIAMVGAVLGASLLGLLGGLWARGQLSRALASLTQPPDAGEPNPRIHEIGQVRRLLDEAATAQIRARERAEQLMQAAVDARAHAEASNAALRELSLAVEQSPESIAIRTVDGRIQYVNEASCRSSGYSRDELMAGADHAGATPQPLRDDIRAVLAQGLSWKGELPSRRKDGSEYFEFAIISPLRQSDGRISHHVSVKEDVTEKKRIGAELDRHRHHLEELVASRTLELEAARAAAEAASLAKSEFLANMSHEIRTPMNAISGLTQLLRREVHDPLTIDRLAKIGDATEHLLQVISDILDLSKIEAGQFDLEQVDFSPSEVLANARALMSERAQAKGLTLQVESAQLPSMLRGDPTRLSQALFNLLSNAVKFTDHGSVQLKVETLESAGARVCLRFRVRDTGIGIAAEPFSRLFSAFVQADTSTTRRFGGTGLGLAITQRLVTMMGGEIGATSQPGVGSEFWFTAWFEPGAATAADQVVASVDAELALRRAHAGARVLLVEDNAVNQEVAVQLLQAAALQVDVAGDGAQALQRLRHQTYDVILMDVQMPNLDGLQAARRIRELPGLETLPIVAMTANAFGEDRLACLAAGMNDYLSKPVNAGKLYRALLRWLPARPAAPVDAKSKSAATSPPGHGAMAACPASVIDDMPVVPGLDTAQGLHFMGGRGDLYRRTLTRFARRYGPGWLELDQPMAHNDRRAAALVVHSLRGAAATIGAASLAAAAAACELVLTGPEPAVNVADATSAMRQALVAMAGALQRWLDDSARP